MIFGSGAVAGAFGLTGHGGAHPVVFGGLRAVICAVVLTTSSVVLKCCSAATTRSAAPALSTLLSDDRRHYARTCFFLFSGEVFYILGVALAGPVTASLWQPSQPVFTLLFVTCSGLERFRWRRLAGILVTVAGCAGMLVGAVLEAERGSAAGRSSFAGNVCLLLNCLSTPVYLIVSRPLLARGYHPVVLAAATFWGASLCFALAVGGSALVLTRALGPVVWLNGRGLLGCVYVALVGTALPFPLQVRAPSAAAAQHALSALPSRSQPLRLRVCPAVATGLGGIGRSRAEACARPRGAPVLCQ
jgi:drug/metabolite transporter (DMT)-like permease